MTGAIAFALVQSAWQGVVMAAALWVVLRTLPRSQARARYVASLISLAAMLGGFLLSLMRGLSAPHAVTDGVLPAGNAFWPAWIWAGGAAFLACYRLAAWGVLRARIRRSAGAPLDRWVEAFTVVRGKLRAAGEVRLVRADWLPCPAVYGFLKPVILVPAAAVAGLTPRQLEAILAHELAHVVRWDYLIHMLQTAAETILFHHPAAWWISRQVKQERECCCDQMAAEAMGERAVVAQALLAMEEYRVARPVLAATGGSLRGRIERLLGNSDATPFSSGAIVGVFVLLMAANLFAMQELAGGPYFKWLTEDVLYIIRSEERAAFLRLQTDAERQQFIAQFWSRRDPTPDTEENEAKKEHYRRISYANERYRDSAPGWKTDRGRMYIVIGPPDEIQSWPTKAFDRWIYKARNDKPATTYEFQGGKLQAPAK